MRDLTQKAYICLLLGVRRKQGTLVPLERAILVAACDLCESNAPEFHGYQVARQLADDRDRKWLTAYGTLYRALARLEAMGLLASRWEDPQIAAAESRPGRRLYVLTAEGLAALETDAPVRTSFARLPRRKREAPA